MGLDQILTPTLCWGGEQFGLENVELHAVQENPDWWRVTLLFRCRGDCGRRWAWPEVKISDIWTDAPFDDILTEAVKVLVERANEAGYYPGERLACPDCRSSNPEALP